MKTYTTILSKQITARIAVFVLTVIAPFISAKGQTYCSPSWEYNADGNMITQVIFGDINQTSPFTSGTTPDYEDFTAQSTTVETGNTYPISVKGPSSTFPSDVVVFIDFNQNGSFDDAGESFYIGRLASANPANAHTITGDIVIPANAVSGATRMRVLKNTNIAAYSDPNAASSITGACGSYRSGQTEDYTVTISSSTPTAPVYCTPSYTGWAINEPAEPITLVQLGVAEGAPGAINNSSVNEVSTTTPRHEDFSSISMDVVRGESYTLLVKANTNGNNTNYITVYFDWNGDGTFSNATPADAAAQQQLTNQPEKHQHTTAIINSDGADEQQMIHTVTIPTDAFVGPIGMRIVKNINAPSNSPCTNPFFPRGQVEDYTLNITESSSVHEVEVTTENNVPATITTANGTLQLIATVLPVATAPQDVTWSIESGTAASVDQNGLVTAIANGSVTVRATSDEDNTKYDEIVVTVNIPQTPATVPFTDDFETNSDWTFVNQENRTTKWVIGNAVSNGGTQSLYVSNDDGATLSADLSIVQTVHAYRDIIIPQGATIAELSFDWRSQGDFYDGGWGYDAYNYMQVHITPANYTPTGGNFVSGGVKIAGNDQNGDFLNQNAFITYTNTNFDISSFAGQTIRVIFTWRNINGSNGLPAAIDNFSLTIPGTGEPEELTVVVTTENNVPAEITTANGTLQLVATVTNEISSQDVIWTVQSGGAVVSVDANGLVTALANGTAVVRATSVEDYNKSDEIEITVSFPVVVEVDEVIVSVLNDAAPVITTANGTLQLIATVNPSTVSQDVTWSVESGSTVVSVDANGLVSALANGTAIVRATSVEDNTKYDEIEITVNISSVGLETLENNILVYPNPATDLVTVSFGQNAASATVQVIDQIGKQVFSGNYSNTASVSIDFSGFSAGIYQLNVQTDTFTITDKILKK